MAVAVAVNVAERLRGCCCGQDEKISVQSAAAERQAKVVELLELDAREELAKVCTHHQGRGCKGGAHAHTKANWCGVLMLGMHSGVCLGEPDRVPGLGSEPSGG